MVIKGISMMHQVLLPIFQLILSVWILCFIHLLMIICKDYIKLAENNYAVSWTQQVSGIYETQSLLLKQEFKEILAVKVSLC